MDPEVHAGTQVCVTKVLLTLSREQKEARLGATGEFHAQALRRRGGSEDRLAMGLVDPARVQRLALGIHLIANEGLPAVRKEFSS